MPFKFNLGFPYILKSLFFLLTLIPIFFKKFTATFNLGLSFLLSSPKFLKTETPFAFAATKKIIKNSSIAELFKSEGQYIGFMLLLLCTLYLQLIHLYKFFYFS